MSMFPLQSSDGFRTILLCTVLQIIYTVNSIAMLSDSICIKYELSDKLCILTYIYGLAIKWAYITTEGWCLQCVTSYFNNAYCMSSVSLQHYINIQAFRYSVCYMQFWIFRSQKDLHYFGHFKQTSPFVVMQLVHSIDSSGTVLNLP